MPVHDDSHFRDLNLTDTGGGGGRGWWGGQRGIGWSPAALWPVFLVWTLLFVLVLLESSVS